MIQLSDTEKQLARQRCRTDLEHKRRGLRRFRGVLRPGVYVSPVARYPLRLMHCNRRDNL